MAISLHGCSVCGRRFEVKFSFQVQAVDGSVRYYCSQHCQQQELLAEKQHSCTTCGRGFELRYAFQQVMVGGQVYYFCSTLCRDRSPKHNGHSTNSKGAGGSERRTSSPPPAIPSQTTASTQRDARRERPSTPSSAPGSSSSSNASAGPPSPPTSRPKTGPTPGPSTPPPAKRPRTGGHRRRRSSPGIISSSRRPSSQEQMEDRSEGPTRIAILNQKGGTGKTTTAVNLAAGLARAGHWTLLVDLDSQGHVATSLGKKGTHGLYDLFIKDRDPRMCTTALRNRLNGIVSDERLASVEVWLARMGKGRNRVLRDRLAPLRNPYEYILLDCGPALSLLNINALTFAEYVIIPVSCDFLSLVGVKQMLRTLERVNRNLESPVQIMGILPTFYDRRNRISDEAVKTLKGYFRDKVLPPIRVNSKLKEAPRHRQTIFEYAEESNGARDYERVVEFVIANSQDQPGVAYG